MRVRSRGPLYVLICYVVWGLLPIFWKRSSRRLPDNEDHFAIGGVIDGEREELPA